MRSFALGIAVVFLSISFAVAQTPTVLDDRLILELVAREPEIVTPTGLAVDELGRAWVIENHTHQRPGGYSGPTSDRIRVLSDFDASGKAQRITTFAEGFRDSMGLTRDSKGNVYLASRSAIYVLRDNDEDGVADERKVIVRLDTRAIYPHNGLAGFAWDALDNLYFGLGENEGLAYKLIGSDGTTLSGGGEGGSIYRCRPDGSKLTRIATGFWNPYGLAIDAFGRLFCVDNDPDSRGPCRLMHIVPGGDYGYRYRNGRKGLHPFTAWNGELPGTLPMTAGTAEAPSGVVAYESNHLPADYRGQLLVTSWGDHNIERFPLTPRGASFSSRGKPIVKGDENFRPVALATAPDGSILFTDWVDKSYPVHGKGKVWRLRCKSPGQDDGLRISQVANCDVSRLCRLLGHPKQEIRTAAGKAIAEQCKTAPAILSGLVRQEGDPRLRVQALWSLARLQPLPPEPFLHAATKDDSADVRGEAVQYLGQLGNHESDLLRIAREDKSPFVRMQAVLALRQPDSLRLILPWLADSDPFLASAALTALGRSGNSSLLLSFTDNKDTKIQLGILTALRRTTDAAARSVVPGFLAATDPELRRAAIQWVAEEGLHEYESRLEAAAAREPVSRPVFEALLAAKEILAGVKKAAHAEIAPEEYVARLVMDTRQPMPLRVLALRMLRPDHPVLTYAFLRQGLKSPDKSLCSEIVRTLMFRTDPASQQLLRELAADKGAELELRALATVGLAHSAASSAETQRVLLALLTEPHLRRDASSSLRGIPALAEQLKPFQSTIEPRPQLEKAWNEFLAIPGDARAGERIFFHPKGPRCFACHRMDGRGGMVGPDLSSIGQSLDHDRLVESLLNPSKEIAPRFMTWLVATKDGKLRTGVVVEEGAHSTLTIADTDGKLEILSRNDVEDMTVSPKSLMPDKLQELMTAAELRDLVTYLKSRK